MDRYPAPFGEHINTRLRWAFDEHDTKAVEEFLKDGADPMLELHCWHGAPANVAAKNGNIKMLKLFAEHSSPNLPVSLSNSTAIFDAISYNQLEVVKMLVGLGRDPFSPVKVGEHIHRPPLIHAIAQICPGEILKYILEQEGVEKKLNPKDGNGFHPVLVFAIYTHEPRERIEQLLKAGARADFDGKTGTLALQAAVERGCDRLRKSGCEEHTETDYQESVQSYDEKSIYLDLAAELIKHGADPNQCGRKMPKFDAETAAYHIHTFNHGATPAATAAANGHFEMLEKMHGARAMEWDLPQTDHSLLACLLRMEKPVHPNIRKSSIVEWLVNQEKSELGDKELNRPCPELNREYSLDKATEKELKELDVSQRTTNRLEWALRGPPIFMAIADNDFETVTVLVNTGKISTDIKDHNGNTAVWVAKELRYSRIEMYLLKKGFK